MSLNVSTIYVGDKECTLRLTSKALMNFNLKHGAEGNSPVVAVLNAVNDYAARIDLFTNALNHPENKNTIKDGAMLLDLMADSGSWDRNGVNTLILDLAHQSGLLDADDYLALVDPVTQSGSKLIKTLSKLLTGEDVSAGEAEADEASGAENPT